MNKTITKIRLELIHAFNGVLDTFGTREDILFYKPSNNGWSIYQVLEHILLANHFLLRIISKRTDRVLATKKSITNVHEFTLDKSILQRMESTGSPMWVPQRFIEPSGDVPLLQLKMSLHDQLSECEKLLQNEASINAIVSTSERGKIDVFHYLYFLVQHMQRHLAQMERVKEDFDQGQRATIYGNNIVTVHSFCLN